MKNTDVSLPVKNDRFPRIVLVIILAEFCERFSYSGMRAFLALYLRSKLGYTDEGATEIYHIFSTFVYVFPIIGGILADNYLGKYRTILYMMFVYASGNMLVAITAIPQLALPGRLCTIFGLFLITVGTGGIKPCVTSFGGEQFKLPEQEHQLAVYFSIFYFTLCIGSLIAKGVSPILRSEIQCFGDKDCYSVAFGAPGFIVLAAIVIFVSAKKRYVMKEPSGNVIIDFVKCVSIGIKNVVLKRNNVNNSHWLDSTRHQYDRRFIKDIKKTLSILTLFTVMPVFYALLDQMGSRWTLQATKMDGRLGFATIKPDQMQVIAPIFLIILIPLSQKYVYPFLEGRNILKNPLHKMSCGGVLAALSFVASAAVEIYLKATYPELPQLGVSQLRLFNGHTCPLSVNNNENISYTIPPLFHLERKDIAVIGEKKFALHLNGRCIKEREELFLLNENTAISFYILEDGIHRFKDKLDKSKSGLPVVRFLVPSRLLSSNITLYNERRKETEYQIASSVSPQIQVFASKYSLIVGNQTFATGIAMDSGGVYTVMITEEEGSYSSSVIVLTAPNSVSMALLLPQYFIISVAEVLFAVTGTEFVFKEAPETMKAVMTAAWLMIEAAGNVIIIVITRLFVSHAQETQSFIYVGLMLAASAGLLFVSRGYQLGHADEVTKKECRSNSEILYLHVKQVEDCLDH